MIVIVIFPLSKIEKDLFNIAEQIRCEKIGITEHSVLPEPVGAVTIQSSFENMYGIAFF